MGRTKWYESVEEMQADVDQYLDRYNRKRPPRAVAWTAERRTKPSNTDSHGGGHAPLSRRSRSRPPERPTPGRGECQVITALVRTEHS